MANRRFPTPRRSRSKRPLGLLILLVLVVAFVLNRLWPDETQHLQQAVLDYTGYALPGATSTTGTTAPEADFSCVVAKVNDGDTLRCADGTRVRLHAVAARESNETCSPGHPCPTASAAAATSTLTRIAAGKTLSCMQTGNSYNRITAICWTPQGVEVNCAMIQSGTTVVWDRFNREEPICRS